MVPHTNDERCIEYNAPKTQMMHTKNRARNVYASIVSISIEIWCILIYWYC